MPDPHLLDALRYQQHACLDNASPLYGALLAHLTADYEADGVTARLLAGYEEHPIANAVVLKLLAGVHRVVLAGEEPALAAYYPSVGGRSDGDPWPALHELLGRRFEDVRSSLDVALQTNEVQRSGALVGGYLEVGRRFGLPLHVLEIGASAGLNLVWDHYRYAAGDLRWGDPASPLTFDRIEGDPPFDVDVTVSSRRGCDASPIDVHTEAGRQRLRSFVWADQLDRLARLDLAIAVATKVPFTIDGAKATEWLPMQLAERPAGCTTVVAHSIVMQYLPAADRALVRSLIESAGSNASTDRPLAWLRMEPGATKNRADVMLTCWPGGDERLLARTGYHGWPVEWLG